MDGQIHVVIALPSFQSTFCDSATLAGITGFRCVLPFDYTFEIPAAYTGNDWLVTMQAQGGRGGAGGAGGQAQTTRSTTGLAGKTLYAWVGADGSASTGHGGGGGGASVVSLSADPWSGSNGGVLGPDLLLVAGGGGGGVGLGPCAAAGGAGGVAIANGATAVTGDGQPGTQRNGAGGSFQSGCVGWRRRRFRCWRSRRRRAERVDVHRRSWRRSGWCRRGDGVVVRWGHPHGCCRSGACRHRWRWLLPRWRRWCWCWWRWRWRRRVAVQARCQPVDQPRWWRWWWRLRGGGLRSRTDSGAEVGRELVDAGRSDQRVGVAVLLQGVVGATTGAAAGCDDRHHAADVGHRRPGRCDVVFVSPHRGRVRHHRGRQPVDGQRALDDPHRWTVDAGGHVLVGGRRRQRPGPAGGQTVHREPHRDRRAVRRHHGVPVDELLRHPGRQSARLSHPQQRPDRAGRVLDQDHPSRMRPLRAGGGSDLLPVRRHCGESRQLRHLLHDGDAGAGDDVSRGDQHRLGLVRSVRVGRVGVVHAAHHRVR